MAVDGFELALSSLLPDISPFDQAFTLYHAIAIRIMNLGILLGDSSANEEGENMKDCVMLRRKLLHHEHKTRLHTRFHLRHRPLYLSPQNDYYAQFGSIFGML